jgi:hypothetical protein
MAYISYTDVPLYFGNAKDGLGGFIGNNSNTLPSEADDLNRSVIAQQVQLNYTPNIAPVRVVGKAPTRDNFNLAGPPNASLSFSCYVDRNEFDPTDYTGDVGDTGTAFRLGDEVNGISGSGAFLNSFSYTLTPYAPILVQCDFTIYNPMTTTNVGGKIADVGAAGDGSPYDLNQDGDTNDAGESAATLGGDNTLDTLAFGDYAHGAYSFFSGDGQAATVTLSDIETFEAIQYQYTAQRLPVYEVGSFNLKKCELITEEQTLSIQGDNIQQLVPITGSNPGKLKIHIRNSEATITDPNDATATITAPDLFTSTIDGRLNAENVSIQGGDLARGSITITELLK